MCDPRFSSHQLVMLSYTHSMVTMEPQQTHHDTEVVNDRWDIERGSKWWGGGGGEEAEETGQVAVTAGEVYSWHGR